MAARRFADELTDIPSVMGHKARSTAYALRWPVCMLCGQAPEPIPTRGLCHTCNPLVARWRSYRVDLAGQPPYYRLPEATDGARPVAASSGARVPELTESPGEVVHPGALTRVVPSGAEGVDALRSGVQPTCHSPETTEEETLSTNGSATPADLSTKKGRSGAVNTSAAREYVNHV